MVAQHYAEDCTENRLRDFVGKLDERGRIVAVNECLSEKISDHHDDAADGDADRRSDYAVTAEGFVRDERDDNRLQTVYDQGDEHRQRIENQIA